MVVSEIHKIRRNRITLAIKNLTAKVIPLDSDRIKIKPLRYGHASQHNPFSLIEPDRILVQIHKCLLRVISELGQTSP